MQRFILYFFVMCILSANLLYAQSVRLEYNTSSIQINYAADKLKQTLLKTGYSIQETQAEYSIILLINSKESRTEAFRIIPENNQITIIGGDGRGVIYGVQSLIEDLRNGLALNKIKEKNESPTLHFRAIKFDLPWDTYRHSYSLTQHQETCADLKYWEAFLDMMCENRFNTLTLWNLHPYTFLIKPKNFPEASPWNDAEIAEWKKLFTGIFDMAFERGIDTYLIPFNIFVTPEFSRAHNVAVDNLEHHHFVPGDTSEIIKTYTQECVTQTLEEYPNLTGMGLTLGEGMGGMTPQQRENWIGETIIEGMRLANRKSKLIHRIPFSGTTGSLGATSIEMEQITRKGIEREAEMDCFIPPVWASLKFNWSHAHSTPKLIKVHGGKLYGTYWNPEPKGYKIIWTARNEDFFCLRWGVSDFVREHIQTNAHNYVGGYFVGSETYIPAKDYFTNPDIAVDWKYAFERQWLFYKIWGRLLYNHETPDEVFKNEFIRRYGNNAEALFYAFALAGKTPLRLASSFDCTWDFTLYSEGFMALNPEVKRVDYISVDRQINQPPLDTGYVSIKEYVDVILSGNSINAAKITPPALADMLETDCKRALELIKDIDTSDNSALMFEIADVKTWANLGLFFAEKIRGAVALQTFYVSGGEEHKQKAVKHLENALTYWDVVISITRPIYNDMPLVHYSEQDGKPWQENDHLRFHWALLRPEVMKDVETAKKAEIKDEKK
ncbi:MAG: hypothetical protein JXR46_08210 [Calditrichaceae bacterium]|nr:hypothetical protein [Calditrichaceae bacterium]MBN2709013.1 hypothetical protein [Calditrichaceae bacterium]RQV95335.1 MAG: hypothetical protein EH224_07925 [Calditrichota bacterium]